MNNFAIIIMAGGLGKRMNSNIPKVLHCLDNKPMLVKIIETSLLLKPKKIMIVVGKYKEIIIETIKIFRLFGICRSN
jgi:bifunctional N-acetylglucosamine-1-phosphate-uridyltransferase/glucosamine-1-phosphate-acetyltransferase GlmU-like protein